jgi:FlaA1/EpsC-like NDP-sugar epimerase
MVRLVTFIPFRLFEGLWKYTGLWDLRNILLGVLSSTALFAVVSSTSQLLYPRSILIIDTLLLVCLMTGIRLARRVYTELVLPSSGRKVLIFGAGDAGELIVRDMRQSAAYNAIPVGFIDDDDSKRGQRIHGVPVLGNRDDLPAVMQAYQPEELLLAIPTASKSTLRAIVRLVEPYKIRITTLPRLRDLIGERVEVGQIRQLKVEDLLGRDPIGLDYAPVRQFLAGKCVLVTGAGGSIGSELCRQVVAAAPSKLILLDRYENTLFQIHHELSRSSSQAVLVTAIADVTDAKRIEQVFAQFKPSVVFHAAAHKHVPLMENNACEAVKNNIRGTRLAAQAALRHGVERFVLISTDKAVNPTSVMGRTKRVAELMVTALGDRQDMRFVVVRFGNVLGSNGSVVPTFLEQIAKGGPVTVTHPEMRRFFMLIPEAVQLVLHAAALEDQASLYVLDMGEQVKVADLARDLIRLSGFIPDKDIEVRFTGIRPGEKLDEQLVGDGESAEPSSVDKVFRIRTTPMQESKEFWDSVARLEESALEGDTDNTLRQLQLILARTTTESHIASHS